MSVQRHRATDAQTFYAAIGINRLGGERLPHSAVKTAVTMYLDAEGREIGRVERAFARAPSLGFVHCYLAAESDDASDEPAYIWL
jgi:hypothetical protein